MVPLILLKGKISDKKLLHYSSYLQDLTGIKVIKAKTVHGYLPLPFIKDVLKIILS